MVSGRPNRSRTCHRLQGSFHACYTRSTRLRSFLPDACFPPQSRSLHRGGSHLSCIVSLLHSHGLLSFGTQLAMTFEKLIPLRICTTGTVFFPLKILAIVKIEEFLIKRRIIMARSHILTKVNYDKTVVRSPDKQFGDYVKRTKRNMNTLCPEVTISNSWKLSGAFGEFAKNRQLYTNGR